MEKPQKRRCYSCKEYKPRNEFSSDKSRRGGVSYRCKKCCEIYRQNYHDRYNELRRSERFNYKIKVLRHYGGETPSCDCCKESNIEFLAIDHMNNNGAEHRRELG